MDNESKITGRDASFSYLAKAEENFIVKLTESVPFPYSVQETDVALRVERTKSEEGEISVFGAEKYFNMKIEDDSIVTAAGKFVDKKQTQINHHRMRSKERLGTPSVSSEASWNSQTALLPSRQKKVNERWLLSGFACNGSCSNKKSVHVDANVVGRGIQAKEFKKEAASNNSILFDGIKQAQSRLQTRGELCSSSSEKVIIGSKREDYCALPTVNSDMQNFKTHKTKVEEEPRKSLEVFGSNIIKKEDIAMNLERKLSVLTWDAIPKYKNLPTTSASSQRYEDVESDASSDLFEIENISGTTQPIFSKQTSDGMSGCMTPTSRYEPSETSIEWSVVTASAAGFSVATDYDEKKLAENTASPATKSITRKNPANGLLGCKSHKAVEVADTAYKRNDKTKSHLQ